MSTPRYEWWGHVKSIIRRYQKLRLKEAELHSVSVTPNYSGAQVKAGMTSDKTANAALRELPEIDRIELAAVHKAITAMMAQPDGRQKLELLRLYYWQGYTLDMAARKRHVSEPTAKRWNGEFVEAVAANLGYDFGEKN